MARTGQAELLAIVFVVTLDGATRDKSSWWKSLVKRAVQQATSIPAVVDTVIVAGDKFVHTKPGGLERGIWDSFDPNTASKPDILPYEYALEELADAHLRDLEPWTNCCGILLLDALYPLRTRSHLLDGISLYFSQSDRARPWMPVASMSLLPNHFHPKKILTRDGSSGLAYFDPEGSTVYRRQQLADDPYFYRNGAVYIMDPLHLDGSGQRDLVLGYAMDEPMPRVRSTMELAWSVSMRPDGDVNGK